MKKKFLILLVLITLSSCNNSDNNGGEADDSNVTTLIESFQESYYDVNISPALQNFKIAIETQKTLIEAFENSPTEASFTAMQNQWVICAQNFIKARTYNVVAVKALFYDKIIYNFEINTGVIEGNIAEQVTFDETYFLTKSTASRGLGALEYLLFNNQDSDTAYKLLIGDTYRVDYLLGTINNVLEKTNALIDFWESEYKETFKNATDTSCTANARCLAFNQLINIIDVIRVTKLGKPAGLESSTEINPEGLEAFRSESSLVLLKSALEEIEFVYTNSTINFSEIVNEIGGSTEISDAINTSFSNTYTIIDSIDTSLYQAIINDDTNVELLYDSLLDLVQYFSVDAASILSVTILPTDNDGD